MAPQPHAEQTAPDEQFIALYRARYAQMVRLATLLVDEMSQAEEVVQEAFLALHLRWDTVEDSVAYLRTCVVNGGRDVLRRRRLGRARDHLAVSGSPAPEPDHLRDAIRALPPNERTAVVLRFYEDLTVPQVAAAMGARDGTVKSWLHRALGELREVIDRGS